MGKGLLPRNQPKNKSKMSTKLMMRKFTKKFTRKFTDSKMSQSTLLPPIDHNIKYLKQEFPTPALGHYHAELADPTINQPNVLQIAKTYRIAKSTLRGHVKTPGVET